MKLEHGKLITDASVCGFHLTMGAGLFFYFCGPPKPSTHVEDF